MTRNGMTGTFEGKTDIHSYNLRFTVRWPDSSDTVGSAYVDSPTELKEGLLIDGEITDTFTAHKK